MACLVHPGLTALECFAAILDNTITRRHQNRTWASAKLKGPAYLMACTGARAHGVGALSLLSPGCY
jgi:hypothetical protein